jgi:hypothetical protein
MAKRTHGMFFWIFRHLPDKQTASPLQTKKQKMFARITATSLAHTAKLRNGRFPAGAVGAVRNLNVHEHISMELFNANGIATPEGFVAFSPEEAEEAYKKMGNRKF